MKQCKQAIEESECGKTCCCLECETVETCSIVCDFLSESCEYAFEDTDSLAVMKKEAGELIQTIADLTVQKKKIEDQEKAMRGELLRAMERYGVKSFENGAVKFVYIAPTTRTTIDSAKLKKELPGVAEKYSKTSDVSASVKITVK